MEANGPSQEELLEEAHKHSMELVARMDDMMLAVVKAQVTLEAFMIELLNTHGRDPVHGFFTSQKIKTLKDIDPPEVGLSMWELCRCAPVSATSSSIRSIGRMSSSRAIRCGMHICPSRKTSGRSRASAR